MKAMFKVVILAPQRTIFEGEAKSVFLPGDTGEFEILEFHKPVISLLKEGLIIIDRENSLAISRGIARMRNNELVVLVER